MAMLRRGSDLRPCRTAIDYRFSPMVGVCVCGDWARKLVVQDDIKQRAMDLQPTVVVNKTQLSEPVHKEADSRARCAKHFRKHLLTDLGNYTLMFALLAKTGEQQKDPGQPLFARIEKLINQILFVTDVPR